MTARIEIMVFLGAALLGTIAAADPADDWPKPKLRPGLPESEMGAAIAEFAQKLHDAGHFSGVILVAGAQKTLLARAYGFASVETKTPNTVDTVFNIGSLNKEFTKVAITELAEVGKLSLDDTVQKHLPDVRIAGAEQITIRQLLEHRSGLGDIFGPRYDAAPPSRLRELADFLPLFADEPLGFAPGTSRRYSNAGYILLGLIVERLSGEKYRDYVTRHIFGPAGMTRSGFWAVDETVANRAIGYTLHGDHGDLAARVPNTRSLPGRASSAGGAFATAGDLLRFYEALSAGKLPADARARGDFGMGGGAPGVNAAVERESGWTVIVLSNLDPPSASALAHAAMDIIRGRPREGSRDGVVIRRRPPSAPE